MPLLGLAFFLSGAAALVYQVVWQRILTLHTGIGIVSVSVIVASFMAGLGIGSELGGLLSARLRRAAALRGFALLELGIAAFAFWSCRLLHDGFGRLAAGLYESVAGSALAHFAALLVPTTLMGMSLPLLVRASVRDSAHAASVIATLYGVNVLGAATGALLAPWLLVRYLGMEGAVRLAALLNLLAATAALAAGRGLLRSEHPQGEPFHERDRAPAPAPAAAASSLLEPRLPFGAALALYGFTGFVALSLEIVWFRVMDVGVKSTAYTFGTVLALYLLGLGAGSLIGARRASRLARPLAAFLDLQLLLLIAAGGAFVLLVALPPDAPGYRWFAEYWRGEAFFHLGADWNLGRLLRLYAVFPLVLFGLPTVLMGLSFGALQRAVQDDPASSGRKVGLLQAANIAGCTAGSLLTGLVLLERLGSASTVRLLIAAGGTLYLLLRARQSRAAGLLARAAAVLALLILLPTNDALWRRLHGIPPGREHAFIGEDASAVSAMFPGEGERFRVTVNGLPHSWLPFEGIHTLLGALPALIHEAPREVAVIGLGSGETAWAVSSRPETESVTVYEIAASQPRLLLEVARVTRFPSLAELVADRRVSVRAADGRRALARSERRYDVIEVDALYLTSAGSGNLYSVEFFELCRSRLKPGGVVCSQKPGRRVGLTFSEAFPHVLDFGNIVIGSEHEIPLDPARWQARLRAPEVARRFDPATLEALAARLGSAERGVRNPTARMGFNRDLFPRDEFGTPAGW